jgi:Spy/CpxP family protein refolding chaperone
MLKKAIYSLVILAIISSLLLVSACRHYSPEKRTQWMMKKFTKDLKLNDSQKDQLDVFKTEMVMKGRELRVAYKNTMEEMGLQLRSDEFDKEKVEDAILKIKGPQDEFISLFINKLADFHSSLTAEQKTILAKKLDKMKNHGKRRCRINK